MASTPNFAWPTPDDTDPVGDGALDMRSLGDAIDSTLGSAWITYTPTLVQAVTVSKTTVLARYKKVGKTVNVTIMMNPTSTGTGGSAVQVGLPVAARVNSNQIVGSGFIYDNSPQFNYNVSAYLVSTTVFSCLYTGGSPWGSSPNLAITTGDQLQFNITYEAA
jgi:hypothetical protein